MWLYWWRKSKHSHWCQQQTLQGLKRTLFIVDDRHMTLMSVGEDDENKKIKRDNTEKVWGAIFGSKMAFVWVAQPKWPHNSSTGIRQHVHNTTLPECKHWVGHPTHAECSHYNACPDHTSNCFYGGADLSSANIQLRLHSQVTDYTMESRLPCGSWGDSGQNSTAYVVYTWYINIFQRTIKWSAVYLVKTLYTSDWHTSIANLLKRIHKSSAETLVYFFSWGTGRHERTEWV